jgi:ketosteroid isomerase-like protein
MRRTSIVVAFCLLFSFSFISYAGPASEITGAQSVDEAWRKAVLANNLDDIMTCYSRDAVMWLPDTPEAKGPEAIRKAYAGLLDANTVKEAVLTNTRYETVGDLSVGWGNYSLTLLPKSGGNPIVMSGRFSVIARQEGGKWAYIVDHASPHPAALQQPKQ